MVLEEKLNEPFFDALILLLKKGAVANEVTDLEQSKNSFTSPYNYAVLSIYKYFFISFIYTGNPSMQQEMPVIMKKVNKIKLLVKKI